MESFYLRKLIYSQKQSRNQISLGILLIYLTVAFQAFALNPARSVYQYNCRSWTRQSGLPANGIFAITQTDDGYLWLGTPRGLVRFDGEEFRLLEMTHLPDVRSTIITSISRARDGGFWFGMERGAFGYCDGRDITLLGRENWGGKSLLVQSVLESGDGELWIGAERLGARLIYTNRFEPVLVSTGDLTFDVTALAQGSQGRIWLGTSEGGLYYWEHGTLSKFPDPQLDEQNIRSIVQDKAGRIWVGTNRGLFCYDANFKKRPFPYPWYETRVLLADREGDIWAGTSGGGLVRIQNGVLTQFRQTDGLADDFVSALTEDQEGSLWVGTRNGLSQFSDVKIPTFGKHEGLTADVNVGVFASRGAGVWVATGEGFSYLDRQPHVYPTEGLGNKYIMNILEARNGDLYIVNGSKDIEIFSGGKIVARYSNKEWPSALTEDSQGVLAAIGGKLYRVGTNDLKPYDFLGGRKPPLHWMFSMIVSRDGAIWMGGNGGICRVKDGTFTAWTTEQGLPTSKVMSVCEDEKGVIWAGLESGMARIKDGRIRVITKDNGLFDNIINVIVPDDYGSLWVDSSRGFFSVSRKSLNDFADGKTARVQCVGYNGLDAIKSSEKYQQQPSGCKTPDGRIYFPTAQGIVIIDPTNIPVNPVPPNAHIHSVRANGREVTEATQAVVPPGNGDLEFHYGGLSYIAPLKILYRYRLSGHDQNWVDAGTRRGAFYTDLKPGRYQFEVQACNEDGVWSAKTARFGVELRPYYYQTIWFRLLLTAFAVAIPAGAYVWRTHRLKQNQRALQKASEVLEVTVRERTASLQAEVEQRFRAQAELEGRKSALEKEIEERKRMQLEVEKIHGQLVDASRMAGQAEFASSVLHNVGNVLNSVNVSTGIVSDRIRSQKINNLARAVQLMQEHSADLGHFITADEKGRNLPAYLAYLAEHLGAEQTLLLSELKQLADNVDHIKQIVALQQSAAKVAGATESMAASELVEGALKMQAASYHNHGVVVERQYEEAPPVIVDRHKVLQILINLFQNARLACEEGGQESKKVIVLIRPYGSDRVTIQISDNGVGIAPENMNRIFTHGFTTRKDGHGFGLHSAAQAAREMGGTLSARSRGPGTGAIFVLELPVSPLEAPAHHPFREERAGSAGLVVRPATS